MLAEAITGRPEDAPINQAVKALGAVDTDPATARIAGALRFVAHDARGRRVPSGIDAIVAAHAAVAGTAVVFTTNPTDLRRLLGQPPRCPCRQTLTTGPVRLRSATTDRRHPHPAREGESTHLA